MKILLINGSHRKNGNTHGILEVIKKEFEEVTSDCEIVDLADYDIQYCQGHESSFCREKGCPLDDNVSDILDKMKEADAIIIASPVYMGNVTGKLKSFMDRSIILRRKDFSLRQKVGAAIAIGGVRGGGQEFTILTIQEFMLIHDMTVVSDGKPSSHFGVVVEAKNPGDFEKDEKAIDAAKNLAKRILSELQIRKS